MNTTKRALVEAATLVGESAAPDGSWRVRIINEGRGSSGYYSANLLETHAKAFSNALSFKNHPVNFDGPETRDFTMVVGKILGETWAERDDSGRMGIYGNFLPDPEFAEKLERYRDRLGLSIFIEGSGEVNESGDFEVLWLNEMDPYKSVDVVIAPGRGGKLAVESLRRMYAVDGTPEPGKVVQESRKETKEMDEKVLEALQALSAKFDTFLAAQEAKATAQEQAVDADKAVADAIESYDAAVAAIAEADLMPAQAKAIRAAVKEGADPKPLIEQALEVRKELEESLAKDETNGYVREGESKGETYTLRGFGGRK